MPDVCIFVGDKSRNNTNGHQHIRKSCTVRFPQKTPAAPTTERQRCSTFSTFVINRHIIDMANTAATPANPTGAPGHMPSSPQSYLRLKEHLWIFPSIILPILAVICWVLSPQSATDYDAFAAMRNLTARYLGYDNGSNGLYHSMSVFELSSIGPANWSEALQVAVELEAELELPSGNIISKMWNESLDSVSVVIESSQELNTRGKWDLYILFVEYKALSQSKRCKGVDYENLLFKILSVLKTRSTQLEELEGSIISARRSTSAVQLSLYSTKKQLRLDSAQRGLARWLASHFRGDRAVLRRHAGLNLTLIAIKRASEVAEYLSEIEVRVKSYKDNIIAVHVSVSIDAYTVKFDS
ncbi:hypothetical protein PSTT_02329 [Puccinia striiformis]|uniref:Uncharacterized protein n=1 Tax=Puccinia striiformis TaxID=27350 RepID=A0A2S4W090_9BASI|nr:hypothetical protein PSTT_02329 [Puccinia striiformis]